MASLFESVTSLMGQGQNMSALGSAIGANPSQTSSLVNAAAPAMLGGMADRASQPGGAGALMGMLGSGGLPQTDNIGSFLSGGNADTGSSMLNGLFGNSTGGMVSALARQTGLGSGLVGKALPMIAPIIMSVVARRAADDGLDEAGLTQMLGDERVTLEKRGLLDKGVLGATAGAVGAGAVGAGAAAAATMGSASDRVGSTVKAGTGRVNDTVTTIGDRDYAVSGGGDGGGRGRGGFGWLGWVLGALVALAVLAWLLSQCGSDAGDVLEDGAATVTDAAEDAVEAVEETAEDAVDAVDEAADDVADAVTPDGVDVDTLQADVDASLDGSGVTGVVAEDGSVTLTGEVETDDARQGAADAVAGLADVTDIDNQITVAAAEEADSESASTINAELDLDPINFEVNSANITADSTAVLDQAAEYLESNGDVEVEIAGHTDSDGDEAANETLSQARAEAVRDYLVNKGIDTNRMTPVGYGENDPIADNTTAEGKAENRRIEFRIK